MRKLQLVLGLFVLLLGGCSIGGTHVETQTKTGKNIAFIDYKRQGFIAEDTLPVYDRDLNYLGNKSGLLGQSCIIDSISKAMLFYNDESDDSCHAFNLVHVKIGNAAAFWTCGKAVMEPIGTTNNPFYGGAKGSFKFALHDTLVHFLQMKKFGVGTSNWEGLSMCSDENPVMLEITQYGHLKPVHFSINKEDSRWWPFMVLDDNDGWKDTIERIEIKNNIMILGVYREFQEGASHLTYKIQLSQAAFKVMEYTEQKISDEAYFKTSTGDD